MVTTSWTYSKFTFLSSALIIFVDDPDPTGGGEGQDGLRGGAPPHPDRDAPGQ